MSYTPASIVASLGLIKGDGLNLNNITTSTSNFSSSALPAKFKQCLTAAAAAGTANSTAVLAIGGDLLPGMLGSVPADDAASLASSGFTGKSFADAAQGQAEKIFPSGDISSFVQNMGKASGAAAMAGDLLKAAQTLGTKGFDEFGAGITKISDLATGGLGKLSMVPGVGLKELGTQMQKLGSSENLSALTEAKSSISTGLNTLTTGAGAALDGVTSMGSKLSGLASGAMGSISGAFGSVTSGVGGAISSVTGALGGSGNMLGAAGSLMTNAQAQQVQGLLDFKNNVGNAINVSANLIGKGLGSVGGLMPKLSDAGLPTIPADLKEFAGNTFAVGKASDILGTINAPTDIASIKSALNIDPSAMMTSAKDLLNPTAMVPELNNFLDTNIYGQMPKLLNSIPGGENIADPQQLGEMLAQLEDVPATDALDAAPNFVETADLTDLASVLPEADSPDGTITTADLIGVVSGGPIATILSAAKTANDKLVSTTQGQTILTLLTQLQSDLATAGAGNWTTTAMGVVYSGYPSGRSIADYKTLIETQMNAVISSSSGEVAELATAVGEDFSRASGKLTKQISGLSKMGVDLTAVQTGSLMPVIGFGRGLADMAKQPGNEDILVAMCSDDAVGQALKLHIVEKKNLAVLEKFGMSPPNVFKF